MILQTLHQHLLQQHPHLHNWNTPHNNNVLAIINPHNNHYISIHLTNTTITIRTKEPTHGTNWTTTTHNLNDPTSIEQIEQRITNYLTTQQPLNTNHLIPTQAGLRATKPELQQMINHIKNGGTYTHQTLQQHNPNRTTLITIIKIPHTTPKLPTINGHHHFIRDGLHRTITIHIARTTQTLHPDEYTTEHYTIKDLTTPNLQTGWITPFNPITQVRLPNFHTYKQQTQQHPNPLTYIQQNPHQYRTQRTPQHTIHEIAQQLLKQLQT